MTLEAQVCPAQSKQLDELFVNWGNGDKETLNEILPLIYNELRRLARYHLRQQRPNHTLQTTALVHEAYLRLATGFSRRNRATEGRRAGRSLPCATFC